MSDPPKQTEDRYLKRVSVDLRARAMATGAQERVETLRVRLECGRRTLELHDVESDRWGAELAMRVLAPPPRTGGYRRQETCYVRLAELDRLIAELQGARKHIADAQAKAAEPPPLDPAENVEDE
jgi:hypothetical protein